MLGVHFESISDHFDKLSMVLQSTNFIQYVVVDTVKVIFVDCFQARMELRMWITGKDAIRGYQILEKSHMLNSVSKLNDRGFGPPADELKHFQVTLNTSTSSMDVLARDLVIDFSQMK
jgi:hypothetical protein